MRKMEKIKLIRVVILLIILGTIANIGIGIYKENKFRLVEEKNRNAEKIINENQIMIEELEKSKEYYEALNIPTVPENYLGFKVTAKLEIPKINLETFVLKNYDEDGMKVCASKFWGPEPNEVGNFCIAGHNYEQERMFNHLIDLEVGDELYLSDNINGKKVYTIYDIYKVKPQNTQPIEQETDGEIIVTLITCVNYSRNRLIVQARSNS